MSTNNQGGQPESRVVRRVVFVNQNWDTDLRDWFDGEWEHTEDEEVVFLGTADEVGAWVSSTRKARLVLVAFGENPDDDRGVVTYAWFRGTPTKEQLAEVWCGDYGNPEQHQDAVADLAGLERWVVGW